MLQKHNGVRMDVYVGRSERHTPTDRPTHHSGQHSPSNPIFQSHSFCLLRAANNRRWRASIDFNRFLQFASFHNVSDLVYRNGYTCRENNEIPSDSQRARDRESGFINFAEQRKRLVRCHTAKCIIV